MRTRSKKNVAAIISAMGTLLTMLVTLVRFVREKGGEVGEDFHRLGTPEGEPILERIAALIVEAGKRAKNIFTIAVKNDGRTTEQVVAAGGYDGYVDPGVNSANFPRQKDRPEGLRAFEFIEGAEFDHDPSSEEVIALAESRGLERPTYDDGLDFGAQNPEEQRKAPLVFLHKEQVVGCNRVVVVLDGDISGRDLDLSFFDDAWGRRCRFPFVRKSQPLGTSAG